RGPSARHHAAEAASLARTPMAVSRPEQRARQRRVAVRAAATTAARTEPAPTTAALAGPPVVEFRGVSKRYEGGDVGLDQATFSVTRGEFVFLVGATGSGKSTVIR